MMVDVEAVAEALRRRIGEEGEPFTHTVEAGALVKFARATGETSPVYLDESYAATTRFGGLIASPTWVSIYPPKVMAGLFARDLSLRRFLHTDDIAETSGVIRAGDRITALGRYAAVFARRGRLGPMLFQAADVLLTNQHKGQVAKIRVIAVNFE